ncbi:DUF2934 domain-containing protein [Variovorax sp. IB41]|uniref:DUF2934 domain-containing protein n=1 Tax=Variovorax sp. IB41 TaxID=2779370 RepID=UPI0018E800D8|nr:DUF2934 domain-containing protein [Variovorax sp. IB41]MBJ2154260.1 DUF2934 domain-containing protein [Variovorax sp. IB41]
MPKTSSSNPQRPKPLGTSGDGTAGQAVPPSSDTSAPQQPMQGDAKDPASREARIRDAAYDAYVRRDGAHGDDVQDWLDAEAQLDGRKE